MSSQFPEYGSDYAFSKLEEKVLAYWKSGKVFSRSLEASKSRQRFFFYDGPPFATGLPHYGHILAGTIKDVVPRYWAMSGFHVERRFGWDCHGLPVEYEMEKTLGLNGSLDIQAYGVSKFNEACRGIVLRYASDWRRTVERMGRWVDMDHDYKTMDLSFMESVWWIFKELWKKGLIYEGKKVVPYSWRLTAPLSNFEASQNYKDVQDPALTVLFPIHLAPNYESWVGNTAFAVWTTTPWTLPSNLAIAAHLDPNVVAYGRYRLPEKIGSVEWIILNQSQAETFGLVEKSHDLSGQTFLGWKYAPLFSTYQDDTRKHENAFRVLDGSKFVSGGDGTGLVHLAPAFGEDDYQVCREAGITLVDPTDMNAAFTQEVAKDSRLKEVVGMFVKDADKAIIKILKDANRVFKHETLVHSYPFCERSDTPLIYKAVSSWFVSVESLKTEMIENNQKIHWTPNHIKDGRFGKWLENARDWCISRNRFWGTPIPVWKCRACGHVEVVGSQKELESLLKTPVTDLHLHIIDPILPDCPSCHLEKGMSRTPEVLDCWFESGSMPYAQEHYPFENKEKLDQTFPADFIAEGLDQTRGWFYTLTVLSTALFKSPAFKNCIVNGIVLAEDGRKMSKRLKNYPDPADILNRFGADALRLYLMQSPAVHGEELKFSERGLLELVRSVMIPLWNSYGFFASYANIDGWSYTSINVPKEDQRPLLDQWILSRVRETQIQFHKSMKAYDLASVAPLLIGFIDDLTNWYIRLSRDRFWADSSQNQNDKNSAYATLHEALNALALWLAPCLPFYSEVLFSALQGRHIDQLLENPKAYSVHEQIYKLSAPSDKDLLILSKIDFAKRIILLGRSLRGEVKIGLRQPLSKIRIAGLGSGGQSILGDVQHLILDELNIKGIDYAEKASDLVHESAKPQFKVLGKKAGSSMKAIQAELQKWTSSEISAFEKFGTADVLGFQLVREDVEILRKALPGKVAASDRDIVVELDVEISEPLLLEGLTREMINRIQQRRKDQKLNLSDRISVVYGVTAGSKLENAVQSTHLVKLLKTECLVVDFSQRPPEEFGGEISREQIQNSGEFCFEIKISPT
jgi:isoleucyl-tRNA synthetase